MATATAMVVEIINGRRTKFVWLALTVADVISSSLKNCVLIRLLYRTMGNIRYRSAELHLRATLFGVGGRVGTTQRFRPAESSQLSAGASCG